ncbi:MULTISPECIES: hypothetical protein [unclassified Rickettsia]|uniref:hypothetical protein n=1 Tax=unclassified Rickettsia TaxID=114295 RepID=UPI003132BE13
MTKTRLLRRHFVPPRNDDSGSHATTPIVAELRRLSYPRNNGFPPQLANDTKT